MPLCAHLKEAEETSYSSQGKAHACLKMDVLLLILTAEPDAALISLPLNLPLSESSMRWLKLTGC